MTQGHPMKSEEIERLVSILNLFAEGREAALQHSISLVCSEASTALVDLTEELKSARSPPGCEPLVGPTSGVEPSGADLAQRFHETYERLAPSFGYETREASAKPWADVPAQNKALIIAVCAELIAKPYPSQPSAAGEP